MNTFTKSYFPPFRMKMGDFYKSKYFLIATFIVMGIFVKYNSIFFKQYFTWTLALVPLMIVDSYQFRKTKHLTEEA